MQFRRVKNKSNGVEVTNKQKITKGTTDFDDLFDDDDIEEEIIPIKQSPKKFTHNSRAMEASNKEPEQEESKPNRITKDCDSYLDRYFGDGKCRSFMIEALALDDNNGCVEFTSELMPDLQSTMLDNIIENITGNRVQSGGVRFI